MSKMCLPVLLAAVTQALGINIIFGQTGTYILSLRIWKYLLPFYGSLTLSPRDQTRFKDTSINLMPEHPVNRL